MIDSGSFSWDGSLAFLESASSRCVALWRQILSALNRWPIHAILHVFAWQGSYPVLVVDVYLTAGGRSVVSWLHNVTGSEAIVALRWKQHILVHVVHIRAFHRDVAIWRCKIQIAAHDNARLVIPVFGAADLTRRCLDVAVAEYIAIGVDFSLSPDGLLSRLSRW